MLKKGNKAYIVFIAVTIPLLLFFLLSNTIFGTADNSVSENYQSTLAFSDYLLKLDNATYNTDTKELKFTSYLRLKYDNGQTEPSIYSISLDYALEDFAPYNVSRDTLNEYATIVTVPNVDENFRYIRIFYQSKKADTIVAERYDEFGNIIPAQTITGETVYISIIIDKNDITFINNSTPVSTQGNTEVFDENNIVSVENESVSMTKKETTLTASETPSVAVSTTTPKVTTVTSKTSQNAPQTVVTTTTKKPSTPKVTTATTTTKKPTTVTTTTPKKTTVTTAKATTTTKKPTVTTTTTKKATTTTTTTKKKTTTTTTTTKATTTTTVYIRLTGLALAEKGSEELLLGESITLTPVYTPSRATNKKVYWESNRPDRVIVDSNGKCTAVGVGAAVIICTSDDGGLTAAYMIIGVDG